MKCASDLKTALKWGESVYLNGYKLSKEIEAVNEILVQNSSNPFKFLNILLVTIVPPRSENLFITLIIFLTILLVVRESSLSKLKII